MNIFKNSADSQNFEPKNYWKNLISGADTGHVEEVGHPDMGRTFNSFAYRIRLQSLICCLKKLNTFPPKSGIFEGAFGVGYYLRYWQGLGCKKVAGVDLSETACKNVRSIFRDFDLRAGDLAEIHFWSDWNKLDSTFGVVTAIDVIYHIIDDKSAKKAVQNLATLVKPGGILVITDKFPAQSTTFRECVHVVRRPIAWYDKTLEKSGLRLEGTFPVFWCMDPPVRTNNMYFSAALAYLFWGSMRAFIKYWPQNSKIQNFFGGLLGRSGQMIDHLVVPRLTRSPNLTFAVYRKK